MKKILLKLFNKKLYQEYKESSKKKERNNTYLNKVLPKLDEILSAINSKEEISFLHSGHLGDVIYSLPLIKEISKNKKCNLFIEVGKKIPQNVPNQNHPFGDYFLTKNASEKLLPLLKNQNFISDVKIYNGERIDINLNLFREMPINFNIDAVRWYFHLTGIHANLNEPYVSANKHQNFNNNIVIMRSLRRQNDLVNYSFLNDYKNILFLGLNDEYISLKKNLSNLEHYESKNFLELAEIINSSKVFIGNLSFGFALAEGLKVPRLLESGPDFPLVYPTGANAFDFYFQKHFESLFLKLYKN